MKIKVIQDKRGYFLSVKQYEDIRQVEVDGKVYYYIPAKARPPSVKLDKDEILEHLRMNPSKKDCALRLDIEEKQLNNFLKSQFKSISVKAILAENCQK